MTVVATSATGRLTCYFPNLERRVSVLSDDAIHGFKSNDRTESEAAFATGDFATISVFRFDEA
jgi:hypothetical protein